MKLKFDPNLDFQDQAINSVIKLFKGQNILNSQFTVSTLKGHLGKKENEHGIGNALELDKEDLLNNLRKIQLENGISQTKTLTSPYSFDIEMETGTGKTYVYLRTIYELNKNYGFSKFIIVVPSIAIKEGVNKTLEITDTHLKEIYDNEICDYFTYDSKKLDQVRDFAIGDNIKIMIINIDAFRKDLSNEKISNIIYRQNDKLNGMKPIELIKQTNPIVIIDEPQSVDNTPKSKKAIKELNPLCLLRYSATITQKTNLIYKLDAVDAYQLGLVKQIEVAGFETTDYHNKAYMKLKSVDNKKTPIKAKIELDVFEKGEIKRKTKTIKQGDDLYEITKREIYSGCIINEIYCEKDNEYVDFTNKPEILTIGKAYGDIDDLEIKKLQIRKTIEEHLNKELELKKHGIKVLSLFFIDKVSNYRIYDENGNVQKGIYAKIFEEQYNNLINKPKYKSLFSEIDNNINVEDIHNGYFSIDKKPKKNNNKEKFEYYKDTSGTTKADEDTYNLIMKDKERLLDLNNSLKFIFSHSALREGWDNPNVFQICTLNETKSDTKKRQEIGRGLRLCVNQNGERIFDTNYNLLTVMANESYEKFANDLQKEIEKDQGIKFGVISSHTFANIKIEKNNGETEFLGEEKSNEIYETFKNNDYIDEKGLIQDKLKLDLQNNTVQIPEKYSQIKNQVISVSKKVSGKLNIKNINDKKVVKLNKQVFLSPEFKELWDKIKYKTKYSIEFDSNEFIEKLNKHINLYPLIITPPKIKYNKAKVDINQGGITAEESERYNADIAFQNKDLPDIITFLQNQTDLTRNTIVNLLIKTKTLPLFKKNPQKFMEEMTKAIKFVLKEMLIEGIKYTKIGDEEYYTQQNFENEELIGYLNKNMIKSEKSIYEYVIYDSSVESEFAKKLEQNNNIKVYAKLPSWFKIPTPIGEYNPDWAILVDKNEETKLYFVVETKGSIEIDQLRGTENFKILCGERHFEALNTKVHFEKANNYDSFMDKV